MALEAIIDLVNTLSIGIIETEILSTALSHAGKVAKYTRDS